ncbi:DUF2779 domain-containing protein [Paracoccus sp. TD-10]|uniref:DUF2779 domain-containing protein n=1 Tax=Paracoccus sp. TD-10 TaxID=3395918 RepID=UPI003AAEADE7
MANKKFGLSKSKIAAFEQCPKRLWLHVHRAELADIDDAAAAGFAAGNTIGAIACSLLPDGVMVKADPDLKAALRTTEQLIAEGHPGPIFEATFSHDGVLVRIDILERDASGGWAIREVKSSTRAKDHHHGDLATQVWVAQKAGVNVSAAAIRHIDSAFVLGQTNKFDGLFADTELLDDIGGMVACRDDTIREARTTLAGPEPVVEIGGRCASPYACEFTAYCNRDIPAGPDWPVDLLPYGGGRKWRAEGIEDLMTINATGLEGREANIVQATQSGRPYHDVEEARRVIDGWSYPRAWIDFETIAFAAPRWVGTRPYQQIPFQFSVHLEEADGSITHHEFLHLDGGDPRHACAQALVAVVPAGATLVAYNASFEKRVLEALAAAVPTYADRVIGMAETIVDLLPVARQSWYHRDQRGSWSLKAVLPTIAPLDYAGLEVKDGGAAQAAYLEAIDLATTSERKLAIAAALRSYCERDTWAMVVMARALRVSKVAEEEHVASINRVSRDGEQPFRHA